MKHTVLDEASLKHKSQDKCVMVSSVKHRKFVLKVLLERAMRFLFFCCEEFNCAMVERNFDIL
jgi:hypothetical protein